MKAITCSDFIDSRIFYLLLFERVSYYCYQAAGPWERQRAGGAVQHIGGIARSHGHSSSGQDAGCGPCSTKETASRHCQRR